MISVIIPTFNCRRYICEAIDSVLCQTYPGLEILVIDDGSTDGTKALVEKNYPAIRYFYGENKGVSSARNIGIQWRRGELIAFLDSDDKWLPQKLEKQARLFQHDTGLGMVFTENYFFNEKGILDKKADKKIRLMHGDIVRNIFLNSYVVTSTVMVRKSVFDIVGLFEQELSAAEDDNMWMRIGMKYRIGLIDEPMLLYRLTEGSLSRTSRNIFAGVTASIDIMKNKHPDLYSHIGN